MGDPRSVGLEAETEELAVAVVARRRVLDREGREVAPGEGDAAEEVGAKSHQPRDPGLRPVGPDRLHPHQLAEERAGQELAGVEGFGIGHEGPLHS